MSKEEKTFNDKYKQLTFNGSHGNDEDQLNNLLNLQRDEPFFWINRVIPMIDRGHSYFWVRYRGTFPKEKEWWNKE